MFATTSGSGAVAAAGPLPVVKEKSSKMSLKMFEKSLAEPALEWKVDDWWWGESDWEPASNCSFFSGLERASYADWTSTKRSFAFGSALVSGWNFLASFR